MTVRIISAGDDFLRVDGGELSQLRELGHILRNISKFQEVVDGVDSLTVMFDPLTTNRKEAAECIRSLSNNPTDIDAAQTETIGLDICFDEESAPDLQIVCEKLSLSKSALIDRLCCLELSVDMLGFVPGFAYIKGLPSELSVPRLETPRQSVPAGSLGMAAGRLGTYALEGPGGWQIIGRIQTPLFQPDKDDPFTLKPGTQIRLKAVDSA